MMFIRAYGAFLLVEQLDQCKQKAGKHVRAKALSSADACPGMHGLYYTCVVQHVRMPVHA